MAEANPELDAQTLENSKDWQLVLTILQGISHGLEDLPQDTPEEQGSVAAFQSRVRSFQQRMHQHSMNIAALLRVIEEVVEDATQERDFCIAVLNSIHHQPLLDEETNYLLRQNIHEQEAKLLECLRCQSVAMHRYKESESKYLMTEQLLQHLSGPDHNKQSQEKQGYPGPGQPGPDESHPE